MFNLNKNQKVLVKELKNTTINNYDLDLEGINLINNLLDKNNIDIYDVEEDGLNIILDRETLVNFLHEGLKEINDESLEDIISDPMYQDLALIGRENDDYYYLNGYSRVEHVNTDDVLCELDDIIDYLQDNN